jgi:hypothetical protein
MVNGQYTLSINHRLLGVDSYTIKSENLSLTPCPLTHPSPRWGKGWVRGNFKYFWLAIIH